MFTDLDLAALLCSRLCHDLVGPVGAIANGIEVMEEEKDVEMKRMALSLLEHSASQATRRLKFYRLAFGASGGQGIGIRPGDARDSLGELLEGGRVQLLWTDRDVAAAEGMEKNATKLLLNMGLMASEMLPRGGELTIEIAPGEGALAHRITVVARGEGARISDDQTEALQENADPSLLEPKSVPIYLAARLAASCGSKLETSSSPGEVRLVASA